MLPGIPRLNDWLVDPPSACFFMRIGGEAMLDAGIHKGDILLVNRSITPKNNTVIIARLNDEFLIRYFFREGNQVELLAGNENFQTIRPQHTDSFEVWGVVAAVIRKGNI